MPLCDQCKNFVYRKEPSRRRRRADPSIEIFHLTRKPVARCTECAEEFVWLPPNFDMKHRYNKTTHLICGGQIELETGH